MYSAFTTHRKSMIPNSDHALLSAPENLIVCSLAQTVLPDKPFTPVSAV